MPVRSVAQTVVSYNATITALERGSQRGHALQLLKLMERKQLSPSSISFDAAMNSCAHGRQWQMALSLFAELERAQLDANLSSYNALLNASAEDIKGDRIFQEALENNIFRKAKLTEQVGTLDLHDLSQGAAEVATRWWLATNVPGLLEKGHSKFTIITGWGRTRPQWQQHGKAFSIQEAVVRMLKTHGISARVNPKNPGRLELTLQQADLGRLSGLYAASSCPESVNPGAMKSAPFCCVLQWG